MSKLDKKPSFNKTNVGRVLPGGNLIVTDTNKVLCDYPAFTKKVMGGALFIKRILIH